MEGGRGGDGLHDIGDDLAPDPNGFRLQLFLPRDAACSHGLINGFQLGFLIVAQLASLGQALAFEVAAAQGFVELHDFSTERFGFVAQIVLIVVL
jgi:hypothetical protein